MNPTKPLLALTLLAMLSACGAKEEPQAPAMPETTGAAPAQETPAAPQETMTEAPALAGADVDAPALYAKSCASCHGDMAQGTAGNPALDKLSATDIQTKLSAYRAGEKMGPKTPIMAPMAKNLSDEQIAALARYLGS